MVGHQNYCVILQSSENSKRNRERGEYLGRQHAWVAKRGTQFVLFRIHGCVVQRSLNENMIFVLYCFRKSFSMVSEQITINHGFYIVI